MVNMVSGAGSIPVSVTPDGRIMERSEVVEYLKALSQHILIGMRAVHFYFYHLIDETGVLCSLRTA